MEDNRELRAGLNGLLWPFKQEFAEGGVYLVFALQSLCTGQRASLKRKEWMLCR